MERAELEKLEEEENKRKEREEHLRQRGGKSYRSGVKMDKQTQVRLHTQSDLRHQSKILRDHGLVMGHINDQFFA